MKAAAGALAAIMVIAVTLALTMAPISAGTFTDTDGNLHEENIERLVDMGVAEGCDDDPPRFCPNHRIFRGSMATFLARALDLPPAEEDHFDDDDGNIHEENINAVAEAGVALGVGPRRYRAGGYVTRAQMATFLARGFELAASRTDAFADDDGSLHEDNINAVAAADVASGCDTRAFCPRDDVTRAQMATFIVNAVDATEPEPQPSGSPGASPSANPSPSPSSSPSPSPSPSPSASASASAS
jgi:hypothetical protein